MHRTLALIALSAALVACEDGEEPTITQIENAATVRVVNATNTGIDVAVNGTVAAGNSNLAFGTSSTCLLVNSASPGFTMNVNGTTTALAYTPTFTTGGKYVVVATTNATGGTDFTTVRTDAFTASAGSAGVAALNAITGAQNYDLYVTAPNATLTTATVSNLAYGVATPLFNVTGGTAQQFRYTNAGTQTVALNGGNSNLGVGSNFVAVVGPPATGTTALRGFVAAGC